MRIQDVRTNIRNDLIMNDTLLLMPILTTTNPRDPSMLQCWIAAFVGQPHSRKRPDLKVGLPGEMLLFRVGYLDRRSKRPVVKRYEVAFSLDLKQQVQNTIVRYPDAMDPAS
jgi:hypothetical protein